MTSNINAYERPAKKKGGFLTGGGRKEKYSRPDFARGPRNCRVDNAKLTRKIKPKQGKAEQKGEGSDQVMHIARTGFPFRRASGRRTGRPGTAAWGLKAISARWKPNK